MKKKNYRESSSIYIVQHLLEEEAEIAIYDPKVPEPQVRDELLQRCPKEKGLFFASNDIL